MHKVNTTAAMLLLSLTACTPAPISDAQLKLIVEQCAAKGYATRIFNSGLASRAECAETKHEGH
jgi:hypothetical protein